jgi:glycosyltransferase involved in cell wall biosynthesis
MAGREGWDLMLRRNDWFQECVVRQLVRLAKHNPGKKFQLFSFSYTACRPFRFAKSQGWRTVLEQIDPGPTHEKLAAALHCGHVAGPGAWQPAPSSYWEAWREECRLADSIIVNSSWSRQALLEDGVNEVKIRAVPLAYEAPPEASTFCRRYPDSFTFNRPLRVLFLGQVALMKGMAPVLDAMLQLRNEPVEFWFVGPRQMVVPVELLNSKRARWIGTVPRSEAARYYKEADVFLFPTLSDGFGLTQLEAQAWKLPAIVSRFCGEVFRDGVNGIVLHEVSGKAVSDAVRWLIAEPSRLGFMSRNSIGSTEFGLERFASRLLELAA